MQTITCPHCKKSFEPSDALESELTAHITDVLEKKHKDELAQQKRDLEEKTEKKIRDELELKLKDEANATEQAKERSKKLQEELLETNKLIRNLKEKDEDRKREMEKTLLEETDKIRLKAREDAEKDSKLKLLEKEKQLQDALKEAEDMKRKLSQGSQQSQGEVFELDFEENLLKRYPHDKVSPVGKGIKGGDIIHEVWDKNGNYAGKILWELKNTKAWSEGWVEKLKIDKRAITGDEAVIISEILPSSMKIAGFHSGVWVTQPAFAFSLADTIRAKLIQLQQVKNASKGKDTKMEILYNYLSGTEFKNRVEAIVESFSSMQQEIEKEKRYFSNKWARDEKAIRQVIDNTIGMHGDLKGIIGSSLPTIKDIDLLETGE